MGQKVNPIGFRIGVNHAWGQPLVRAQEDIWRVPD